MKMIKVLHLIGSISFGILSGLGHLMFEFSGQRPLDIIQAMEGLTVSIPGKETNMLLIDTGFSMIMGLMLLAYGIINIMIIIKDKKLILPPKSIIFVNIIFSFIAFVLVYKYLFIIPLILKGIAFISFSIAYILYFKKDNISR